MNFYTSKEIKARGWLKKQLEIQANGLSGHLDKIWRDVRDSKWIGGNCEGWERVPYWLDGFIPLAYLLNDADMIERAKKYMDAILDRQEPDGWICPCSKEERKNYDTWAVQLITKVLVVYYDCSEDARIPGSVYRAMKNYFELLSSGEIRLFGWGKFRWFESFVALNFLHERFDEPWIAELARLLDEQGYDYQKAIPLWKRPLNKWTLETHVVNLAMMLKYSALTKELLGGKYDGLAPKLYDILMRYNATPVGIFTGDECLSGISAIQGTELCAVAELMYSCEILYAYTKDQRWADLLEKLAFNAMPATVSDDMWTHQYLQMANQINCIRFPGKAVFRTNGPEAHLFGLEPHYGCCTANFNQAFPKFALSAFMRDGEDLISVTPVPCALHLPETDITVDGDYPFRSTVTYTVTSKRAFTLKVRIPAGTERYSVNGKTFSDKPFAALAVTGNGTQVFEISFTRRAKLVDMPNDLKVLEYGSLVFSLNIDYEKKTYEYERNGVERKFPYCDYEYIGTSEWRYGYASEDFEVVERTVGDVPFSSKEPPIVIKAKLVPIDWDFEDGFDTVAAKLPTGRTPVGKECEAELYPYGCAKLRMTEMPLIQ